MREECVVEMGWLTQSPYDEFCDLGLSLGLSFILRILNVKMKSLKTVKFMISSLYIHQRFSQSGDILTVFRPWMVDNASHEDSITLSIYRARRLYLGHNLNPSLVPLMSQSLGLGLSLNLIIQPRSEILIYPRRSAIVHNTMITIRERKHLHLVR
jgi:hypothetical protein